MLGSIDCVGSIEIPLQPLNFEQRRISPVHQSASRLRSSPAHPTNLSGYLPVHSNISSFGIEPLGSTDWRPMMTPHSISAASISSNSISNEQARAEGGRGYPISVGR